LPAQSPGSRQDAEEAREKLFKAADQLDNIQANSEATKLSVDGMKGDITSLQQSVAKLQAENTALKQEIADLQTALDNYKDQQLKSRQKLIDDVAGLIAADKAGSGKPKKKTTSDSEDAPPKKSDTASNLTPPPDKAPTASANSSTAGATATTPSTDESGPAAKPQKGYWHEVAFGETLTMICSAYRDNGVKVTVAEVRKANGLTEKSQLKAGQKLFIPQPVN
jgi:regulator of replication initiation timing